MSPRMTVNEVCAEFRKAGISISSDTLTDGIENGTYPFGRLVSKTNRRRTFEIWRKDVLAFIEGQKTPVPVQPSAAPEPVAAMPAIFPAPLPTKAAQVMKWATVCSNPRHQEHDCDQCPYRATGLCMDNLLADAAAVLMDMTLLASARI